ncbi:mynd finger family protein [Stemphylium lycopersici]|uniref:Mynd finger family protein n=1 Tax=Stemphylium lycopersici TaxID=183478 RepID=A0A364N4Y4_STELY|nr:mynd finger family protein [Stemphylium lycopersici]RAR12151.1 mynd finger family protein [Stemphylium lycopersici]
MAAQTVDLSAFLNPPLCANTDRTIHGNVSPCERKAAMYCGKACQKADWRLHKTACKGEHLKETWQPRFFVERRFPSFMSKSQSAFNLDPFGSAQYLWGNIPAVDMLNAGENEGMEEITRRNIALLFAASGDLRNVVKTVTGLPKDYAGECLVAINDWNFCITARNAMILLTAMHFNPETAVPIIMHLWYSVLLPTSVYHALQDSILPYVKDVCDEIAGKADDSQQAKTFKTGNCSVRIVLKRREWVELAEMFKQSKWLSLSTAMQLRQATTMAPQRIDYVDKSLQKMLPARRTCAWKFRLEGLLLPYGTSRKDFVFPNPQVKTNKISFRLFAVDATKLPDYLGDTQFDRIEVSNICDRGYVGVDRTLQTFSPMLKSRTENPHATLLMLFLNAVREEESFLSSDSKTKTAPAPDARRVQNIKKFLPHIDPGVVDLVMGQTTPSSPGRTFILDVTMISSAMRMFDNFDDCFNGFLECPDPIKVASMDTLTQAHGMKVKTQHTIIKPWPYRVTNNTTKEEFSSMLSESTTGDERYMEFEKLEEESTPGASTLSQLGLDYM